MISPNKPIDYNAISKDLEENTKISEKLVKETLDADLNNPLYAQIMDEVLRSVGAGGYNNQMQTFLVGLDRFQRNILQPNAEHSGFTFITRPRLCLQTGSLKQHRAFAPINTMEPNSIPFMIRCLLDTKFHRTTSAAAKSLLLDANNPFFTPLCNALTGISGYPDLTIQTLTTDSGFHSEDQTFAIGHDQLAKSYDLNLTFKDVQGGPVAAIFYYWLMYIHCVTKGLMIAYSEDIDNQRLNYTVSIYRFTVDPTRRNITNWSKATGSFPKSLPIGPKFNFNEGETFIPAASTFSIPFVTNRIEYNDFMIFQDFNTLVRRYCTEIDNWEVMPHDPSSNYRGIPFVDTSGHQPSLIFKMAKNSGDR
jgi:hypothetical protein